MPSIESIRESQRQYSDQPYLWLLEINLPSGETIRICRNPEQTGEIEWPMGSGQVWQEFAFEFDDIDETSKAETRQLTLKVANASGVIMQYVEDLEDWRKVHGREPCTIRLIAVNAGLLDQAEPEAEFWFEDKGVSSPPPMKWVIFRVGTMDVFSRSIPRRRILRDYCSWETTDQCQHVATCDRTLRTCRDVYNFSVNFGGFPVVERGAIYG
jgi:phage-related protein